MFFFFARLPINIRLCLLLNLNFCFCKYAHDFFLSQSYEQAVAPADALAKLMALGVEQNVAEDAAVVFAEKHTSSTASSFKGSAGAGGATSGKTANRKDGKASTKTANGSGAKNSASKKGTAVELF